MRKDVGGFEGHSSKYPAPAIARVIGALHIEKALTLGEATATKSRNGLFHAVQSVGASYLEIHVRPLRAECLMLSAKPRVLSGGPAPPHHNLYLMQQHIARSWSDVESETVS